MPEIDLEEMEHELNRPVTLDDYLKVCELQQIRRSRALRVLAGAGGDFRAALVAIQLTDELEHPEQNE